MVHQPSLDGVQGSRDEEVPGDAGGEERRGDGRNWHDDEGHDAHRLLLLRGHVGEGYLREKRQWLAAGVDNKFGEETNPHSGAHEESRGDGQDEQWVRDGEVREPQNAASLERRDR